MSDLVVVVYPDEQKAEAIRQRLFELQKEYLIKIGDAVIATRNDKGHVRLNQLMNTTAVGAASGSLWGMVIGAIFLMPLVGAAIGAASGAIGGALTDYGINDRFMKQLGESLQPGSAALFVLVQEVTGDKVLEELRGSGGVVLKTSLDHTKEKALREALAAQPITEEAAAPTS